MRVLFLGDLMCQKELLVAGGQDLSALFDHVKGEFAKWDAVVVNLETPIAADAPLCTEDYSFNAPPELVKAAVDAGIRYFITANNHCLDRGVAGLEATVSAIRKAGGQCIGTRAAPGKAFVILSRQGRRIGLLAFTYGTNAFLNAVYLRKEDRYKLDMFQAQELRGPFGNWFFTSRNILARGFRLLSRGLHLFQTDKPIFERESPSKERMKYFMQAIRDCRAQADYVIVLPHVGGQYDPQPTAYTKRICSIAHSAGADAVLANHEHVVHPVEKYGTNGLTAYSLGNFMGVTGILRAPYDKDSDVSLGIGLDLEETTGQAVYHGILFAAKESGGCIKPHLLAELVQQEAGTQQTIYREKYQRAWNSIFQTVGKTYPLQESFRLG